MSYLSPEAVDAAQRHALASFPEESCGLVIGDRYYECVNAAADPSTHDAENALCPCRLCSFRIAADQKLVLEQQFGPTKAILHSHPNGPYFPSRADMQGQLDTDVVWGIIVTDGERVSDPTLWGEQLPMAPLIGREFMHGIHDCYALVRDVFRLGKDELAAQDIQDWPFDPIVWEDTARDDEWWQQDGVDLYTAGLAEHGFSPIAFEEIKPGDCFLVKVRSDKLNHAGVLLPNDLILHHLPSRLSRREPAGLWARGADLWVRHEANK